MVGFGVANWELLRPRLGLAGQWTEARSMDERAVLNAAAWTLIQQHPALGVGLGNFSTALSELPPETVSEYAVSTVHNLPLLAAAELGVPGGLLWLWLMAAPWIALWHGRRRVRRTPWLAGLSGALAGLMVVGMADYYLWMSYPGSVLLWLLWGLWAGEWRAGLKAGRSTAPENARPISPG